MSSAVSPDPVSPPYIDTGTPTTAGTAMAIKSVDKGLEDEPEPKKGAAPEPQAEAVQPDPPGGTPDGQLPFAKSAPKPPGRKTPPR